MKIIFTSFISSCPIKIRKLFFSKVELSQLTSCLLASSIIIFFYNFPFIQQRFELNNAWICALEVVVNFFMIFILLLLSSFNQRCFKILFAVLLVINLIPFYAYKQFQILIDPLIIANALDSADHFKDVFIVKTVICYILLYIVIPCYFIFKISIINKVNKKNIIYLSILFIIIAVILSALHHRIRRSVVFSYPPINFVKHNIKYYNTFRKRPKLLKIVDFVDVKADKKIAKNLKVVLIIGESARSKNLSINGYKRKTTPEVEKIKNLISFKDVSPCHNVTAKAVNCMLSRFAEKDFEMPPKEESVIKLFDAAEFSTKFYSIQKDDGKENLLLSLGSQAKDYRQDDKVKARIGSKMMHDEYLLDDLKTALLQNGDDFIILHIGGSHFLFNERYPENFEKFTKACKFYDVRNKCTKQEVINAYDNSILYSDFVISSAINQLKDENAIFFYISDHGQFLGENGVYYHGSDYKALEHKVPMFLWMSNSLMKNNFYRKKFENAKRKINDNLSQDYLFGSLLNCSGIGFAGRDSVTKTKSVCR
jgi:lipid A ethanolaminephosphotransferase